MKSYKFTVNGKEYAVDVLGIEGRIASLNVNGVPYSVELSEDVSQTVAAPAAQPVAPAAVPAPAAAAAPVAAVPAGAVSSVVKSPLPGVIISVDVKEGQAVKKGQKVAVLEAMKMENEIQADADGTVAAILVHKGDSVLEGAELIKIS
ncbi:MAG: biotin/lipoyl-binding protein [Bacteroidales bacterium]|nr:biotin/lipoyl-binding protein [Bacteroidales bacterium]